MLVPQLLKNLVMHALKKQGVMVWLPMRILSTSVQNEVDVSYRLIYLCTQTAYTLIDIPKQFFKYIGLRKAILAQ